MAGSPWYEIVWIYDVNFESRQFPLVYLADGRPGYVINQYIYYLMTRELSHSNLELHLRALCHLYAFTCARYGTRALTDSESYNLVANFIDAKQYGTDTLCIRESDRFQWLRNLGLNWRPLTYTNRKTGNAINDYILAITDFDKWQSTYHFASRINVTETHFMNAWERYKEFKNRELWDPLLHIIKSRNNTVETYQDKVQERLKIADKRRGSPKIAKSFPPERIVELVDEAACNVRDKLLLLMMLGGSLRRSEPLHLFRTDIEGMDSMGQAKIRLADPVTGETEWTDLNGKLISGSREEYFKTYWKTANSDILTTHPLKHIGPRVKLDRRHQGLHAGFKGMTLSAGVQEINSNIIDCRDYDIHYMFWCNPQIGAYWYKLFREYEEQFLKFNPHTGERLELRHPWLFIKIENSLDYGMPLTISAQKAIWRRIKAKLKIRYRLAWHSLRHYYGYYCASILGLPIEQLQILMHHANSTSTEVYYHITNKKVRQAIITAHLHAAGMGDLTYHLTPNDSPTPRFPDHWSNAQYLLWQTHLNTKNLGHSFFTKTGNKTQGS